VLARLCPAVRSLRAWHAEQHAIEAVNGSSDHDLRDIGIPREEITAAARRTGAPAPRSPSHPDGHTGSAARPPARDTACLR